MLCYAFYPFEDLVKVIKRITLRLGVYGQSVHVDDNSQLLYKYSVITSQETHYFSASNIILAV
jgi:hypothetical protein